jgi:hypothetical protein
VGFLSQKSTPENPLDGEGWYGGDFKIVCGQEIYAWIDQRITDVLKLNPDGGKNGLL